MLLPIGAITLPTAAQAQASIFIQTAPPPPRAERVQPPRRGYVWAPGHDEARGGRWEYARGRWDRDGDGVPNRADRRPNNPYRN